MQVILRPFYLQFRDTTDFTWTPELQQTFERIKKKRTDGTLRLALPNSDKPFYILCDASNYGIGAALLQKNQFEKNEISISEFYFLPLNLDFPQFSENVPPESLHYLNMSF